MQFSAGARRRGGAGLPRRRHWFTFPACSRASTLSSIWRKLWRAHYFGCDVETRCFLAKLILLVVVFTAAWWLLKRYVRSLREDAPPATRSEDMVRCASCGVHLPRSEGLLRGGRTFCSEEHARSEG